MQEMKCLICGEKTHTMIQCEYPRKDYFAHQVNPIAMYLAKNFNLHISTIYSKHGCLYVPPVLYKNIKYAKIPNNAFYIDYFVAKCYIVNKNKHIFVPFGIPWSLKAKSYSKQILKTSATEFMSASDANYTVKAIYYVKIPKIAWYSKDELCDVANIE